MVVPDEVVFDILSRLPIDKAPKIQVLSKSLAKASHGSYFKDLVARHRLGFDGFLLQSLGCKSRKSFVSPLSNPLPSLDLSMSFLPGLDVRIQAVAPNGILLCESRHPIRHRKTIYTICKLTTKQWKGLPIPRARYFTKNIGMFVLCSNPLHFKILRLSYDKILSKRPLPYSYTICELFDSKTWRWKLLKDMIDFSISHYPPVFASGSAHWETGDGISIYSFDFFSETWSIINKPEIMRNNDNARGNTTLVEYEGKLGIMQEFKKPKYSTELWVMENYFHKLWTKKCDFLADRLMTLYGSEVSMTWLDDNKVMFSNLEMGKSNYKYLEQSYHRAPIVFPFFSDFEPWNFDPQMRSIKPKTMIKTVRKHLMAIQINVNILVSFYFYFVHYNHHLCTILLELIYYVLKNY